MAAREPSTPVRRDLVAVRPTSWLWAATLRTIRSGSSFPTVQRRRRFGWILFLRAKQ